MCPVCCPLACRLDARSTAALPMAATADCFGGCPMDDDDDNVDVDELSSDEEDIMDDNDREEELAAAPPIAAQNASSSSTHAADAAASKPRSHASAEKEWPHGVITCKQHKEKSPMIPIITRAGAAAILPARITHG